MRGGAHLAFAALRSSSGPCDTCRYYRGTGGLCRKNSSEIEMVTADRDHEAGARNDCHYDQVPQRFYLVLHRHLCLPQSCSASRLTAGAAGFLLFTQWRERPDR